MELQIIRTRHPPEAYIAQLADLLSASGLSASPEDLHRRLDLLPRGDRLLMAVVGDHLLGYAHIRVSHDLLHEAMPHNVRFGQPDDGHARDPAQPGQRIGQVFGFDNG